ncbi:MAG: hypothetical protein BWY09_00989 [Candidatus Hydrogenedentes bacterium ADurb.Bin179]|nr:MAG: hypothetical protein BWY09_00989 [Candidatus Hydrogenedentes bacterium ADurb.Bin179]
MASGNIQRKKTLLFVYSLRYQRHGLYRDIPTLPLF